MACDKFFGRNSIPIYGPGVVQPELIPPSMLNLKEPFNDAVSTFQEAGESLCISPLASVVCMMQRDVINHYRHALTHYLTKDLSAPFLQNSHLGTPYQKWARFTNDDFGRLF